MNVVLIDLISIVVREAQSHIFCGDVSTRRDQEVEDVTKGST